MFDEEGDLNTQTEKFIKRLYKTISKCFRKVRITERTEKDKIDLFAKWKHLKKQSDKKSKEELSKVEKELAEKFSEEYYDKIKKSTKGIDCEDGTITSGKLWNLKKELFPKSREPPTAMKDPVNGNLLSTEEKIQEAAINVYTKRLENKPIKDDLKHIKEAKEVLCEKLLKNNKTPTWKMKHLNNVLKNLNANDIFRPEVAGDDLKLATDE